MSIITKKLGFLTTGAKAWIEGSCLMARTSWLIRAVSLFSHSKEVCVDRDRRLVAIRAKYLWIIQRYREIPFDNIRRLDYSYSSLPTSFNLFAGPLDQLERFTISLCLINPRRTIKLFSFSGEGAVATGLTGVLLHGDDIVDFSGDQENRSLSYVDLLMKFTGKTLT